MSSSPPSERDLSALRLPPDLTPGRLTPALARGFLRLAFRMLKSQRVRTFVTFASMVFAHVVLVLTLGLTQGAQHHLSEQVCRKATGHLQIQHKDFFRSEATGDFLAAPFPLEKLRGLAPSVTGERSQIIAFGVLGEEPDMHMVVATGLDPTKEPAPRLVAGDPLQEGISTIAPHPVLLGRDAARALSLEPGGLVIWTYMRADGSLDDVQLRVRGLVDEGTPERNRRAMILELETARRLLEIGPGCHRQLIFVDRQDSVAAATAQLQQGLGKDVNVIPWPMFNPQLRRAMRVIGSQMSVVAMIVVGVAFFGIWSTLSVSLAEKTRELGLFGVLGIGPRAVFLYVILEGLVLAAAVLVAGTVIAAGLLALLATTGIDLTRLSGDTLVFDGVQIDMRLRPIPQMVHFAHAALVVLVASLLAALLPAWRAARLKPAEALRFVG